MGPSRPIIHFLGDFTQKEDETLFIYVWLWGKDGNSNVRNISEIRVGKYETQLEGVKVIIYTEKTTTFS